MILASKRETSAFLDGRLKMRKNSSVKLKFWKNLCVQMDKEEAVSGGSGEEKTEEVSSLLWWLRLKGNLSLTQESVPRER